MIRKQSRQGDTSDIRQQKPGAVCRQSCNHVSVYAKSGLSPHLFTPLFFLFRYYSMKESERQGIFPFKKQQNILDLYAAYTYILISGSGKEEPHMLINEVIRQVDLTRRAVKFYEEKGLLKPSKDANGYRNYTEEDVLRLKEISVYRKLGIRIPDIKKLLDGKDGELLEKIYESKKASLQAEAKELDALKVFIESRDVETVYQAVDYQTIGKAMQDMIPGYFGYYFMQHFQPYLQIRISTPEQQEAYRTILDFWDQTRLHPPLFMTLMAWPMYRLTPRPALDQMIRKIDEQIRMYLNPTAEEYAALKKKTLQNVRLKTGPMKYHPAFIAQRRFMKRLKDCGYYDIFIPAMVELSPKYREYREALMSLNDRICQDLGLYYDSNYNLILKKKN